MEQGEEQEVEQTKDEGESIIPYWYRTEFLALPERKRTLEETLEETWVEAEKEGREEESDWTAKFNWLKKKKEQNQQRTSEGTYEKESIFVSCISEESGEEEEEKKPENCLKYEVVKELDRIQEEEEKKILDNIEATSHNGIMQAMWKYCRKTLK